MEKPKRARKRKPETAKADLKPPLAVFGGQGVHRKVESEGHEEKYRAVIDGETRDEPVGQRWGSVEPASLRRRRSHSPHFHQGVCGRHGTEEQRVTSGGLTKSPGGTGVSGPISESEMASNALSVVGRLRSTTTAVKAARPRIGGRSGPGKAAGEDGWKGKGNQMSKDEEVDQFHE
jgi:hypothetical protein